MKRNWTRSLLWVSEKSLLKRQAAQKLLADEKLRIGWVICCLREHIPSKWYWKCLMFGHFAKTCTSGTNRFGRCRKCEEKGHIVRECNTDPKCLLCKGKKGRDNQPTYCRKYQVNFNHCRITQDLLKQTTYGFETDITSLANPIEIVTVVYDLRIPLVERRYGYALYKPYNALQLRQPAALFGRK